MSPSSEADPRSEEASSLSALAVPWRFLGPVPWTAAYTVIVAMLLAGWWLCSVFMLYETPRPVEESRLDALVVCLAVLMPPLAIWLSFWCVGAAVTRGAPRAVGYVPLAITFVANAFVWLALLARIPDRNIVWGLLLAVFVTWLVEVCLVINPYNCVCGSAHLFSAKKGTSVRAFFSESAAKPELPLVHVYLSPAHYAIITSIAGGLLILLEFIGLVVGWARYGEDFRGVVLCVALRDFCLAAVAASSIVWYQSSLAYLRRSVEEERRRRKPRPVPSILGPAEKLAKEVVTDEDELERLKKRIKTLERVERSDPFQEEIVGKSHAIRGVIEQIEKAANTSATVLITGETGVGKDIVAQVIHDNGLRRHARLVGANLLATPQDLIDDELFGHVKGAFTGAVRDKPGKFEMADGSTIFLNEIGEVSHSTQQKLLHVLDKKEIQRIGATRFVRVDVRIIAATNRDLRKAVEEGAFRQDLYSRLSVLLIHVPPLRERKEDIPDLADYFLARTTMEDKGKVITGLSDEAIRKLLSHAWPGNVRDLDNCIRRAVINAKGDVVQAADIEFDDIGVRREVRSPEDHEKELIDDALRELGSVRKAAKKLNMAKSTLQDKIKRYGLRLDS